MKKFLTVYLIGIPLIIITGLAYPQRIWYVGLFVVLLLSGVGLYELWHDDEWRVK